MEKTIRKIYRSLQDGAASPGSSHRGIDPVDNLILTILSQNTNDELRNRAYSALKSGFPTHDLMADAPTEELERAIRVGGLSSQKSRAIKDSLLQIRKEQGSIALDFLRTSPTEDAIDILKGMRGVGDKTAAIIMLFSFGRPTFPVDTHIQRIMKRIGIVPERYSPEKIRKTIEPLLDGVDPQKLHILLIALGKQVCKARKPQCPLCPLRSLCSYGLETVGAIL